MGVDWRQEQEDLEVSKGVIDGCACGLSVAWRKERFPKAVEVSVGSRGYSLEQACCWETEED